jgi:hypothetical protein
MKNNMKKDPIEIKPGMKLKAKRTIRYFMGQIASDKIRKGEIVTVDGVEKYGGAFSCKEHADRYGPWYPEDFTILKGKV